MTIEGPGKPGSKVVIGPWKTPRITRGPKTPKIQDLRPLAEVAVLDAAIGVRMLSLAPSKFVFQGVRDVAFKGGKIAKIEFTNGQFRKLLQLKPEELKKIFSDPRDRLQMSLSKVDPRYPNEAYDAPMLLYQDEAEAIAALLGKRLPTELEWERAAAYTDGRKYPFGNCFDPAKVTFRGKGTRSVYAHRDGVSPEGVLDLAGNVFEWTSSPYGEIDLSDPENPGFPTEADTIVYRGGCWDSYNIDTLRSDNRDSDVVEVIEVEHTGVRFFEDI